MAGDSSSRPLEAVDPARLDLSSPDVARDPFPVYEALRRIGPVVRLPIHDAWIVLSHAAMGEALARPEIFSNAPYAPFDTALLAADPPRHAPARRLLATEFTGETVRALGDAAAGKAETLLRPRFDLVADFGLPLSRWVAAELIGFAAADLEQVRAAEGPPEHVGEWLPRLIAALDEAAPRAALFSRLRNAGAGEAEARGLVRLTWIAATVTTQRVIARCGERLLRDPALAARLRAAPDLLPRFVEEVLRLHPPEHMQPRLATASTTLGGTDIPAGALVQLCASAANRDPDHYPRPDELSLDRRAADHFAFGGGIHLCLGAALTRRVVRAAVSVLLDASADLRPAASLETIEWVATMTALTPRRLDILL